MALHGGNKWSAKRPRINPNGPVIYCRGSSQQSCCNSKFLVIVAISLQTFLLQTSKYVLFLVDVRETMRPKEKVPKRASDLGKKIEDKILGFVA